jgi:hypothetical protein
MRLQRRSLLHGMAVLPIGWSQLGQGGGTRVAVGNGQELAERLGRARPGDVIALEPGEYAGVDEFAVAVDGVSLVSTVPLGAIIRAPLVVDGDGVILADLAFRDAGAPGFQLAAVAACSDSVSIRGRDVEVKGCDFGYFGARAILVRPTGLRPHIHDCTFHDNRDGGGDHNAHEAISLGYDNPTSNTSLRARVVNNRMWNLNVEDEAISVKTSDNLLQANTLSSSKACFSNRYGERNQYISNQFPSSRGCVIQDRGNIVRNNKIGGSGKILIMGGNTSANETRNDYRSQATSTVLEGNNGLLIIGYNYNGNNLPALNTSVRSHAGSIQLRNHKGTRIAGRLAG